MSDIESLITKKNEISDEWIESEDVNTSINSNTLNNETDNSSTVSYNSDNNFDKTTNTETEEESSESNTDTSVTNETENSASSASSQNNQNISKSKIDNNSENVLNNNNQPKSSIYLLLQDGRIICFSEKKDNLLKVIRKKINNMRIENITNKISCFVSNNRYEIYRSYNNFLINYDTLISSFRIEEVDHYRMMLYRDF